MITSSTSFFFIFGNPVKHSLSPVIHNNAFNHFNIDSVYLASCVTDIGAAFKSMKTIGAKGANITVPFKYEAVKYLDYPEKGVELSGATNTVKLKDGLIEGYNTDITGSMLSIKKTYGDIKNKSVTIAGCGGAARGIFAGLLMNYVAEINVLARNPDKAKSFIENISGRWDGNIDANVLNFNEDIPKGDILINATTVGMSGPEENIPSLINNADKFDFIMDIVYAPFSTRLIKESKASNIKCIDGLDMLVNQAAVSFSIWTGISPESASKIMYSSIDG